MSRGWWKSGVQTLRAEPQGEALVWKGPKQALDSIFYSFILLELLAILLKNHYTNRRDKTMATNSSIQRSKLANLLLNPPVNLLKLSIWTLVVSLILFFIAGLLGQMVLALALSVIAGISVFIAITQTKFFWRVSNYLQVHLVSRENRWTVVVIAVVGVTALIASFFIS
jgi:hypothetical protein